MTVRLGINGLGRIGRCILRYYAAADFKDIEIVAVNASEPVEKHVHLLKYDSTHGVFPGEIKGDKDSLDMGKGKMQWFHEREPANILWAEANVDIVLECTGAFKKHADVSQHIKAGAKKVIISAPSPDPDCMIVFGVNNEALKVEDKIISVGSCTTNCLAPVAKVLNDEFGIISGFMTTIHAYTNDQNILDAGHKDLRRARAAALSMIPTSTGAASAIGQVLPELSGKLDGVAVRVPTPNVSLVDFSFTAEKSVTADDINKAMKKAASTGLKGVMAVNEEPLVSVDFNGSTFSSVFDATQTHVVNGNFCRVAAWYDNEWGFSARMLDVASLAGKM